MSFNKILIANRGEIACRVIRTAKDLGYRTVAVFSEADEQALHVSLADEAVNIGSAQAKESYLCIDNIIRACEQTGADAVHPGYGFLSENADFAKACEEANIVFIGPPVDAIHLMGSKRLSKIAMQEADVPCIPGYQGAEQDEATLINEAQRIGTPLMIKASAGGGGRGMRVVTDLNQLNEHIKSARNEALNAFGSDELILERAVIEPRHVEIQVFCDQLGNAIHLGERDCSIQRRHQKVVEEAPSPAVSESLREKMGQAAVEAAKACNYVGAGTVEFLLAPDGEFYFLEMNTRLQVEHPVTEMITGQDLVAWQIRVARGEALPLSQEQVQFNGHAIEVRLYAEDPANHFLPQTGKVIDWQPAQGAGVRIDHGLKQGYQVSSFYDPMLAKVIAWGENREDARRRLRRALQDTRLAGVTDNRRFLDAVLDHPSFVDGEATTAFLSEFPEQHSALEDTAPTENDWAIAAALLAQQNSHHQQGWHSSGHAYHPMRLANGDQAQDVVVRFLAANKLSVQINERSVDIETTGVKADGQQRMMINGTLSNIYFAAHGHSLYLHRECHSLHIQDATHLAQVAGQAAGSGQVKAPMDGAIIDVCCSAGDTVAKGDTLVVMEAMKMEHSLKAAIDGVVREVNIKASDQVKGRQVLVIVEES